MDFRALLFPGCSSEKSGQDFYKRKETTRGELTKTLSMFLGLSRIRAKEKIEQLKQEVTDSVYVLIENSTDEYVERVLKRLLLDLEGIIDTFYKDIDYFTSKTVETYLEGLQ